MLQATKQHLTSLEGQLHTQAAELAQLAARQSQASATEQSAAGDATLKQRLRKVELTVAGKHSSISTEAFRMSGFLDGSLPAPNLICATT